MFVAALFTIAKTWKQPKCPSTDEWIKLWYIFKMEYYSAIKKNEICSNMDGTGDYHTEGSQTEKDKNHMISLICRILKNYINELITKQKQTHIENKLMVSKEEREGRDKLGVWD